MHITQVNGELKRIFLQKSYSLEMKLDSLGNTGHWHEWYHHNISLNTACKAGYHVNSILNWITLYACDSLNLAISQEFKFWTKYPYMHIWKVLQKWCPVGRVLTGVVLASCRIWRNPTLTRNHCKIYQRPLEFTSLISKSCFTKDPEMV